MVVWSCTLIMYPVADILLQYIKLVAKDQGKLGELPGAPTPIQVPGPPTVPPRTTLAGPPEPPQE
jgi:hypothetical protein